MNYETESSALGSEFGSDADLLLTHLDDGFYQEVGGFFTFRLKMSSMADLFF